MACLALLRTILVSHRGRRRLSHGILTLPLGLPAVPDHCCAMGDNCKILVDDTDASLTWAGDWKDVSGSSNLLGTAHLAFDKHPYMYFQFNGTWLAVYGTTFPSTTDTPPTSIYTVDAQWQPFTPPNSTSSLYNQCFFETSLPNGTHTLNSFDIMP
ncbi:hypothetical protein NEOLEDRAFT_566417 [Neolentinus lepideus HHB14362 ss-1]|uniref:Uncharacterized protein n=1 Tax=Neolentinus lepideus HHB14362 ss-1 TaxID=1314782 RepID=A0A165R3J2_9AGAM|nr:hypothetical protein NEOLEDRAFT_566417 [Neolentinus lepideus HHB14362 ss-1]